MTIAEGVALGPYEICGYIGAGGMGEVWRARDHRIGREVAIKVLLGTFAQGDAHVQRFEREARAAGALNHPGLVTIYDVGTAEGSPYIVMELLEGQTLRAALGDDAPRALPVPRALDYAIQIATALAVAHEKGIFHRDLKPENIFVTSDDRLKILDFGLAKLAGEAAESDARDRTARHLTSAGMIVGTPGYMSPEQVRAQPLDHRTDIFAFGAVLYEMLSGRRAFDRDSAIETMHAVMNEDTTPLTAIDPDIPPALDAVVRHCMAKEPRERFQSARDLAFQLRMLPQFRRRASWKRRLPLIGAAIGVMGMLALAAGGFLLLRGRHEVAAPQSRTFTQLTFGDRLDSFPVLAPDGKSIVFVASQSGRRHIYLQRVDGRTPIDLTGDSPADDSEPAFSPDGSQIAFRSEREGGGIFVMGVTGESVRRLTDFGHNPSWSPDARRLVVSTVGIELKPYNRSWIGELWLIDAATGAKRPLVQPAVGGPDFGEDSDAVQPSWSPHGHRIAFWGRADRQGNRDIWTIAPDVARPKASVVRITSDAALQWNPVWAPDGGHLYFGSDADGTLNLWRVAIDEATGRLTAPPEPLSLPAFTTGHFSFSREGDLAYVAITSSNRVVGFPFDAKSGATGPPQPLFSISQDIMSFAPSPDRGTIAFTASNTGDEHLFIANSDGTRLRQLTNNAGKTRSVKWSPDGKALYFHANSEGPYRIWTIRADGSGIARVTDELELEQQGVGNLYLNDVSADGRTLIARTDRDRLLALVHLDRPIGKRLELLSWKLDAVNFSRDGTELVGYVHDPIRGPDGIFVHSLRTGQHEKVLERGIGPSWLSGGRRIAVFEKDRIAIVDLETRRITTAPFTSLPGMSLDDMILYPRLSNDDSTLYVRQTVAQGNVWLVRFGKER